MPKGITDREGKRKLFAFSLDREVVPEFRKVCEKHALSANIQIENFMRSVIKDYDGGDDGSDEKKE